MRILALPLVRQSDAPIFLHVHLTRPPPKPAAKTPFLKAITSFEQWSAEKWYAFSKKPTKSVSYRIWKGGETVKGWSDWRETFLKNVPGVGEVAWDEKAKFLVEVHHPPNVPKPQIEEQISTILTQRIPHHQQRLTLSIIALPVSMLFILLPTPNIPLMWNLYRLYSNWRALQGAKTLHKARSETGISYIADRELAEHLLGWKEGTIPHATLAALQKEWGDGLDSETKRAIEQFKKRGKQDMSL
ncbi:hypothetical protein HDU85_000257 [Gaertneriomyces sp. JEL0708]|nr:hypothetical protein HDU85_000257 [Gaertneriomyces sp. JEL0708]